MHDGRKTSHFLLRCQTSWDPASETMEKTTGYVQGVIDLIEACDGATLSPQRHRGYERPSDVLHESTEGRGHFIDASQDIRSRPSVEYWKLLSAYFDISHRSTGGDVCSWR